MPLPVSASRDSEPSESQGLWPAGSLAPGLNLRARGLPSSLSTRERRLRGPATAAVAERHTRRAAVRPVHLAEMAK